jgi:DNA-directed RNA polymerase beta' subunit
MSILQFGTSSVMFCQTYRISKEEGKKIIKLKYQFDDCIEVRDSLVDTNLKAIEKIQTQRELIAETEYLSSTKDREIEDYRIINEKFKEEQKVLLEKNTALKAKLKNRNAWIGGTAITTILAVTLKLLL